MWQDWYFTLSGLFYSLVLIPSMLDRKTEVSRKSSVPTAIILGVSAIVWMTMGMHASASMSAFAVLPWAFLAWRRPIRPDTTCLRMLLTDIREIEIMEQYRTWHEQQRKIHEAAGCGTCPSNAGCSTKENYDADA